MSNTTDVMTARELAAYLRVTEVTIYKLSNEGEIPAVRVGRCWRFRRDLIDEWLLRGGTAAQHHTTVTQQIGGTNGA